jgi:hypothetical protein
MVGAVFLFFFPDERWKPVRLMLKQKKKHFPERQHIFRGKRAASVEAFFRVLIRKCKHNLQSEINNFRAKRKLIHLGKWKLIENL